MKTPKVKEDPELQAQQARAKQDKRDQIQTDLGDETLNMMRRFGSRAALAGTSITSPLMALTGKTY